MVRRRWGVAVWVSIAFAALLLLPSAAGAAFRSAPPVIAPRAGNTDITLSGLGPGLNNVPGFFAPAPFDPTKGYPPPGFNNGNGDGFTPATEYFAGIIYGTPVGGGATLQLYCIDIHTDTQIGYGYTLGQWGEANVPNVGYVAQVLDQFYPLHPDNPIFPAGWSDGQKAAATQATVWYFSDGFVLNSSSALFPVVQAMVADAISRGAVPAPGTPSLTITPSSVSGGAGSVLGPFTVTTDQSTAQVTATGATMYSNRAGTTLLGDGTTADVPSGQQIWLRSTAAPSTAVLSATATATVPRGNVYLYDGLAGPASAQKLILGATATLKTTVSATADFREAGSLVVRKTIAGPAAGSQGLVVIRLKCDDGVRRFPFIILPHARRGTRSRTYRDIVAGTTCTVIEAINGSVVGTKVVVIGGGQQATIPSGGTATVRIRDIYYHVGALLVRKIIGGPAAGQQGQITINSVCNGKGLTPDLVIPAGAPAGGDYTQLYHLIVPATCTVTETANGQTSTVSVVVEGSGQTVHVPPGKIVEADISDTYGLAPGQLEVMKYITGPLAGQQGQIVIHTVCDNTPLTPDFVIPPMATGLQQSQIYAGIPTPASCVVTETADGSTSSVSATVIGSPTTVSIPAGGAGAADVTDTYGASPGSLIVTKTITGPDAGDQGPVTIRVVCNGTALSPDFVIPAGTKAGSVSHSFDNIPAGSVCAATETEDGETATISATVTNNDQTVTVPAGEVVPVNVIDVYQRFGFASDDFGYLRVTKTIAGPAAREHGRIGILIDCGGPVYDFAFIIPAHSRAGSVSRAFTVPAGSVCTATEPTDGHTSTVAVAASGGKTVTVPANKTVTVHLTDIFTSTAPVTG
jgi:TQXA domain-containing protein